MALADRLQEPRRGGVSCKMCVLLAGRLSADDVATLRGWLETDVSSDRIAEALRAEGHDISGASVKRHRRVHQ